MKQDLLVVRSYDANVLRVHTVAYWLGCSRRTVRRLIQNGELPAQREGLRAWGILRSDVEAFYCRRSSTW